MEAYLAADGDGIKFQLAFCIVGSKYPRAYMCAVERVSTAHLAITSTYKVINSI